MMSKPTIHVDGKHPASADELEKDAARQGREAQEANEAMNKAMADDDAGADDPVPGLRQSDTGRGSAD